MSTLALFVFPAHHQQISVVAERPAGATVANVPFDLMSTIAIIVVLMLLGFAVSWARTVLSAVWEMTRMLFKTLGVVVLLTLSMIVLLGALVVSAAAR
jgi:hypothetical protein